MEPDTFDGIIGFSLELVKVVEVVPAAVVMEDRTVRDDRKLGIDEQ